MNFLSTQQTDPQHRVSNCQCLGNVILRKSETLGLFLRIICMIVRTTWASRFYSSLQTDQRFVKLSRWKLYEAIRAQSQSLTRIWRILKSGRRLKPWLLQYLSNNLMAVLEFLAPCIGDLFWCFLNSQCQIWGKSFQCLPDVYHCIPFPPTLQEKQW